MKEKMPRAYNKVDVIQNDLMEAWLEDKNPEPIDPETIPDHIKLDLIRAGKASVLDFVDNDREEWTPPRGFNIESHEKGGL